MSEITWRRGSKDWDDGELTHVAELDGEVVAQCERREGTPHGYYNAFSGTIKGRKGWVAADSLKDFKAQVERHFASKQEPRAEDESARRERGEIVPAQTWRGIFQVELDLPADADPQAVAEVIRTALSANRYDVASAKYFGRGEG